MLYGINLVMTISNLALCSSGNKGQYLTKYNSYEIKQNEIIVL